MRKILNSIFCLTLLFSFAVPKEATAKIQLGKVLSGAVKAYQAYSISDEDVIKYVHQYVQVLDAQNKIAPSNNPYTIRLIKLTSGLNEVEGQPLNFKVYLTNEVNAFACADGSVRVYSGLMDVMTDDEVLGVIGHEIGHVAHKDTKNAMKKALMNSAWIDALGATSETMANLTDSQLGAIGEILLNSKFSRKQETNADDYGYDFLKSRGKNPWSMAMAFQKLLDLEKKGGSTANALTKMFSSHPSTPDRIKHIKQRCNKDKIAKPANCTLKD